MLCFVIISSVFCFVLFVCYLLCAWILPPKMEINPPRPVCGCMPLQQVNTKTSNGHTRHSVVTVCNAFVRVPFRIPGQPPRRVQLGNIRLSQPQALLCVMLSRKAVGSASRLRWRRECGKLRQLSKTLYMALSQEL